MKIRFPQFLVAALSRLVPQEAQPLVDQRRMPESLASAVTAEQLGAIFSEAKSGDTRRMFQLWQEIVSHHAHTQTEFSKRKLAVIGDPITFASAVEGDAMAGSAARFCEAQWKAMPGKREALTHLLDSTLFPVAICRKRFRQSTRPGVRWELAGLDPVPHHLLDYREGCLRIRKVDDDGQPLEDFEEPCPAHFVIHRGHLLTSIPDQWGGPMRAVAFWWLFSTGDRAWWARFLERFGAPFMVGHYQEGDETSKRSLKSAFAAATKLFGLVIPDGAEVKLEQAAASASGDAFEKFHRTANEEISKLIIGQTMTADAKNTGLNSNQAGVHNAVRSDYKDFDSSALGETLRDQLFTQLLTINGVFAPAPEVTWGLPSADDAETTAGIVKTLKEAGLAVAEESVPVVSERVGLHLERDAAPADPASAVGSAQAAMPSVAAQATLSPSALVGIRNAAAALAQGQMTPKAARAMIKAVAPGLDDAVIADLLDVPTAPAAMAAATPAQIADARSAVEAIPGNGAAALARAFRADFAAVERIIAESTSADDCLDRLAEFASTFEPGTSATLLGDALRAGAINGLKPV